MLDETVEIIVKEERKYAQRLIHRKQELKKEYQKHKIDLQEEFILDKLDQLKSIDVTNDERISMLSHQLDQLEHHNEITLQTLEEQMASNSTRVRKELEKILANIVM